MLSQALWQYVDVIVPNETELTFISGIQTSQDGAVKTPLVRSTVLSWCVIWWPLEVRKAVAALKAMCASHGNHDVEASWPSSGDMP